MLRHYLKADHRGPLLVLHLESVNISIGGDYNQACRLDLAVGGFEKHHILGPFCLLRQQFGATAVKAFDRGRKAQHQGPALADLQRQRLDRV